MSRTGFANRAQSTIRPCFRLQTNEISLSCNFPTAHRRSQARSLPPFYDCTIFRSLWQTEEVGCAMVSLATFWFYRRIWDDFRGQRRFSRFSDTLTDRCASSLVSNFCMIFFSNYFGGVEQLQLRSWFPLPQQQQRKFLKWRLERWGIQAGFWPSARCREGARFLPRMVSPTPFSLIRA